MSAQKRISRKSIELATINIALNEGESLGATIAEDEHGFTRVVEVQKLESPAHAAGLRLGDIILELNKLVIDNKSAEHVRATVGSLGHPSYAREEERGGGGEHSN